MGQYFSLVEGYFARYGEFIVWLGGISLFLAIITLVTIPLIVISIPAEYFIREQPALAERRHPVLRAGLFIIKNSMGALVLFAGFAMLFIPGQGLLTIMIGLMLMNFPGKRQLELRLIRKHRIKKAVDWMRIKAKRPPLKLPG